MMQKNAEKYADIIDTEYRGSPTRPRMSMHDRAAQFSPFAALTGYGDMIRNAKAACESGDEETEADEWEEKSECE